MARPREVRDPIYGFICLQAGEEGILNSWPLQRLRDIHQCGMTHFVYPGANQTRFEHSLGVMELATRIYDAVLHPDLVKQVYRDYPSVADILPDAHDYQRWRRILRVAALTHDIGHAPFSHTAEDVFPRGEKHEHFTMRLILSKAMKKAFGEAGVDPGKVAKLAVGTKYYKAEPFSYLEEVLSEIITSDMLGADRMDYLLRDSHHIGVAYGRFDLHRLIQSMMILPKGGGSEEPRLGIGHGGLHCAEALLLARYFIYMQVYLHDVRRIYDYHLTRFLKAWLKREFGSAEFPSDLNEYLSLTDSRIFAALVAAARSKKGAGHDDAWRILDRQHFRLLYDYVQDGPRCQDVFEAACSQFDPGKKGKIVLDAREPKSEEQDYKLLPVRGEDRTVRPLAKLSALVQSCPEPLTAMSLWPLRSRTKWSSGSSGGLGNSQPPSKRSREVPSLMQAPLEVLPRRAFVLELVIELCRRHSWCGETHIQKTTYFLQELMKVPLGFDFILYKYGPYSFDLEDELGCMLAEGFLSIVPNPGPYGVTFVAGRRAAKLLPLFPPRYRPELQFMTEQLAPMQVAEVEQLSTALYVMTREDRGTPSNEELAERIATLKPHISHNQALVALSKVSQIRERVRSSLKDSATESTAVGASPRGHS